MIDDQVATFGLRDFETPRLARLSDSLFAACFSLMKLIPARYIVDHAEAHGLLPKHGLICESTSGTFGLALAMVAAQRGYELILVSDPGMDAYTRRRLRLLDCRVEIVSGPAAIASPQRARLDMLHRILQDRPEGFWPRQYSNGLNPASYREVAEELECRLGRIDVLVGTVGSGGSMCGIARVLRRRNRHLRVVGIDTFCSVIFGLPDGLRRLRGLGNSLVPPNVDHTVFDEIHWVSDLTGFGSTRALYRHHGLFMGPTSGCAYWIARWVAHQHEGATVVVLMPDEGHRYAETVYDDAWYAQVGDAAADPPAAEPTKVSSPDQAKEPWCYMAWNRRRLQDVSLPLCGAPTT